MSTVTLRVDPLHPAPDAIARAAEVLRRGGLVAFPTETVYGLGANALDADAVAKIFAAKGRPASNPVIVHVADAAAARALASDWPEGAERLANTFWPGSLTLVVPKRGDIPDVVTAGGPTVALRVPAHPVALALLRACQLPVAAPSANRSNRLSPTRAEHVQQDLDGRVGLILDGGPCPGGLESTVLDVTASPSRLLRPGLVTPAQIEAMVGPIRRPGEGQAVTGGAPLRSPGMLAKHYAPRARLELADDDGERRVAELAGTGLRVGWMTHRRDTKPVAGDVLPRVMPAEVGDYAARMYATLHELDRAGVDVIVAALPPTDDDWLAVHDRLRRASAG